MNAQPRYVAHRVTAESGKSPSCAAAYSPEIGYRGMTPQQFPIGLLIELRYPHALFIGGDVLCDYIHGDLGKVHIRAYACCRRYASRIEHLADHLHGKLMRGNSICGKIRRGVNEHLVNTVNVDVLGTYVFRVNRKDLRADLFIKKHARRGDYVRKLKSGIVLKSFGVK